MTPIVHLDTGPVAQVGEISVPVADLGPTRAVLRGMLRFAGRDVFEVDATVVLDDASDGAGMADAHDPLARAVLDLFLDPSRTPLPIDDATPRSAP